MERNMERGKSNFWFRVYFIGVTMPAMSSRAKENWFFKMGIDIQEKFPEEISMESVNYFGKMEINFKENFWTIWDTV